MQPSGLGKKIFDAQVFGVGMRDGVALGTTRICSCDCPAACKHLDEKNRHDGSGENLHRRRARRG